MNPLHRQNLEAIVASGGAVGADCKAALAEIDILCAALRGAILNTIRATERCIDCDSDKVAYEIDWTDEARGWAALCDLDLDEINPAYYPMSLHKKHWE